MTEDQVIDLLATAQAFDKRTVGEADVIAWTDSAQRARWSYAEASEAIKNYYATTVAERPWIMPSHITNWIRREREYRAMRARTPELTQPPRRVVKAIEAASRSTEIPAEPREPRQPGLRVQCPHCGAGPGESCTRPSAQGRRVPVKPHPSRLEAATTQKAPSNDR